MPGQIIQSTASRIPLKAYLSTDHLTPATGKTIAITISKNGGAYGNPGGGATNATEISAGSYYVDLSTTDTGTVGPLFILGTCSGVDPVEAVYNVVALPSVNLAQVVPTSNTVQTLGDCLNAARAQGFGPWTLDNTGMTLTMYANDGTTQVHQFTLDALPPTRRS